MNPEPNEQTGEQLELERHKCSQRARRKNRKWKSKTQDEFERCWMLLLVMVLPWQRLQSNYSYKCTEHHAWVAGRL